MNKTTCCGCFGAGCLIMIVAVIVGGYFGVNFVYNSGREMAADGLRQSVIRLAEMAFEPEERMEVTDLAEDAAALIKEGKISLTDLLKEVTHQLENNLHIKALLLGFARKAGKSAAPKAEKEAGADDFDLPGEVAVVTGKHAEAEAAVQRVIMGMLENKITSNQLASITAQIAELYTEKVGTDDGKTFVNRSSRRLKKNFSAADIQTSVELLQKICEESGVGNPDAEFDAAAVVKDEIKAIFIKLKKNGSDK